MNTELVQFNARLPRGMVKRLRVAAAAMNELLKVAELMKVIRRSVNSSQKANAIIAKWSDKDLGPNPLDTAVELEARNQVFGWGR